VIGPLLPTVEGQRASCCGPPANCRGDGMEVPDRRAVARLPEHFGNLTAGILTRRRTRDHNPARPRNPPATAGRRLPARCWAYWDPRTDHGLPPAVNAICSSYSTERRPDPDFPFVADHYGLVCPSSVFLNQKMLRSGSSRSRCPPREAVYSLYRSACLPTRRPRVIAKAVQKATKHSGPLTASLLAPTINVDGDSTIRVEVEVRHLIGCGSLAHQYSLEIHGEMSGVTYKPVFSCEV
jgi:hypothetical protein